MKQYICIVLALALCSCIHQEKSMMIGGTARTPSLAQQGMKWLSGQQRADGSWGQSNDANLTSLCLMVYSRNGSKTDSSRYGKTTTNAIRYLNNYSKKHENTSPLLLMAVAEAYALDKTPALKDAVLRETQRVLAGQSRNGSFAYRGSSMIPLKRESALSQSLNLLALKRVYDTGGVIEDKIILSALKRGTQSLIEQYYLKSDGAFRLFKDSTKASPVATASAVLALQSCGRPDSLEAESATSWLEKNVTFDWSGKGLDYPVTTMWLNAEVLSHGKSIARKDWARSSLKQLEESQAADGSWDMPECSNLHIDPADRKIYATCVAELILSAQYIYSLLPARAVSDTDDK